MSTLPPFSNIGHIFLQLCLLSVASPAPSLDATKHRAGPTSWDKRTHILTEMVPGQTSDMLPYCTNVWDLHCHYIPKPLSSTTPQARPALPSSMWSSPDLADMSTPSIHSILLHNLAHRMSLDGWGPGIDGTLVVSILAMAICLVSPRKVAGAVVYVCQPVS